MAEPGVTEAFHRLYYDTAVWKDTYWLLMTFNSRGFLRKRAE